MKISVILASLWLCIAASSAQAHGTLNFRGSEGGIVRALVVAPTQPPVVYAATSQAGVFKSSDNGQHWLPINQGLTRMDVLTLVLDPTQSGVLYAGTRSGLFKSTNGGATWQPSGTELAKEQVKVLLMDPKDSKILFAGTVHGLWKSADAGVTWLPLAHQPENSNITALAIAPDSSRRIYAGTAQGLFRSSDGGESWTRLSKGLIVPSIVMLAFDPVHPQLLYTGTGDGAYRSEDGGDTWRSITFAQTNLPVTALLVDPRHPDTLYLGTSFVGGLFKTEDAGKSWVRIRGEDFTPSITALVFSPGDPKGLIAGTSFYSNVFTSPDSGKTWKPTSGELALPALESITGTPDGELLYAAAHDGLYRFQAAPGAWKRIGDGGVGALVKVAYRNHETPALWVCGSKGIAEGHLRHEVWTFHREAPALKGCADLAVDESSGRVFAAGKTDLWIGPDHWQHRVVATQGEPIHRIALSRNGKTLYALTEHRALQSMDEGKTWERIDEHNSFSITAVADIGKAPGTTWIATTSDISYRTLDGKWVNASQGMFPPGVSVITASPNGDKLYAASQILGRLFTRRINENSWSISDIEEGSPDISDLWADPAHEGVLYAVTRNSGLFRSNDQGVHWSAVNAGLAGKSGPAVSLTSLH
jgi:photosystem II stability/assembly factor-like uncharacterized protein